ncbi:MAG: hypothetical protein ACHQ52_07540 [Candidatus Eisenbacteria bacterium]
MDRMSARLVHWAPRLLAIAFAAFITLFSLDVFSEGLSGARLLAAFAMHLFTTTGVVVASLLLAWRWPWVGAVLFAAAGAFYATEAWRHPSWVVAIGGPLFLTAALFLADALVRRRTRV